MFLMSMKGSSIIKLHSKKSAFIQSSIKRYVRKFTQQFFKPHIPNFNRQITRTLILVGLPLFFRSPELLADDSAELTKKLQNPVAALVSVPLQFNYDSHIGPKNDGEKSTINIQPVIPFSISKDWNIISRTILPIVDQKDVLPNDNQFGFGDTLQSMFFSPKDPTSNGLIWGLGPALLIPTATNDLLGANRWSLGPTFVVLSQHNCFTYGLLSNHLWAVDNESKKQNVNSTYTQPFISYATKTYTTFGINSEAFYDWNTSEWNVPFNFTVSQVLKVFGQPISLGFGLRYWARSMPDTAEGLGARANLTLLFPK